MKKSRLIRIQSSNRSSSDRFIKTNRVDTIILFYLFGLHLLKYLICLIYLKMLCGNDLFIW